MSVRFFQFVSLLLIGLLCMLSITGFSMAMGVENAKVRCIERERHALLNFKRGLQYSEKLLSSWGSKEEDCCRWKGIGCDNKSGHVILLDLRPVIEHKTATFITRLPMTGNISSSLLELQYLSHLDLSFNEFTTIPEFIGSLTKLTYLNLSNSVVGGGIIPHQLGNLSSLLSLDLSNNDGLSVDNLEWLSRLSSLKVLKMSHVYLDQAVDWFQTIQKLPSLSSLKLSGCQLPEIIPSSLSHINSSKSLTLLHLNDNSFNSSIFSWLFNFSPNLVDLRLSDNQLKGLIPDSFGDMISLAHLDLSGNQLEGGIPKSFGNLCNLQTLDLSGNNLTDNLLESLSGCTKDSLEILRLSTNKLSGSVPDITRFPSMRELYLDDNQLEGSIPKSSNLSKLVVLNLRENQLSGSLPDIEKFPSLREFYLDGNQLEGSIPKSFGLSKLVVLSIGGNQLTGSLPKSIGQLSSLKVLNVSSNSLNGVVSEVHLSDLFELQELDLSFNSLALNFSPDWVPPFQLDTIKFTSCKLGHFPSWLQSQKSISHLDVSKSEISGAIPDQFWNLSSKLRYLNLSLNHISGKVPNFSLEFDYAPAIDLSSNLFYGSIPSFLSRTVALNLSKNMFSRINSFLCSMMDKTITYLDLSNNLLSGSLSDCWIHWNNLFILNLENNNLSGTIPSSMGFLSEIETLRLRKNNFSGKLPSSLMNCSYLKLLDLGENKFSGKIPAWIGESLTRLIILRLRSNEFNGNIPLTICRLDSLQVLDLSLNNISGSIPTCLNNFTAMTQKESSDATISTDYIYSSPLIGSDVWGGDSTNYVDNALVFWKGTERVYSKTLGLLKFIDLSSNKLTGEIPGEVTSLLGLIALNLSRNYLIGIIPKNIGLLKLLDSLDLSRNQLGGEIPMSLADISFISYLDFSNNNLSGKIPSSTQLQSFNASTYMGNPQLCGPPLLSKCPGDETKAQDSPNTAGNGENIKKDGEWFGASWSYASMGLGFALGLCGVCGTLLLNSSWRHAYFQFLNDMYDWFYVAIAVNIARLQRRH